MDVAIRKCAVSAHEAFLRHPWACSLCHLADHDSQHAVRASPCTRLRLRYMEWLLWDDCGEAGFSAELTLSRVLTLWTATSWGIHDVGTRSFGRCEEPRRREGACRLRSRLSSPELRAVQLPVSRRARRASTCDGRSDDGEPREFEFGLDLILDGLKQARGSA